MISRTLFQTLIINSKPKSLYFSTFSHTATLTKTSCIYHLKNCKSMNQLKQIQTQIFITGLRHDRDTLNKLMVFTADPFHGNLNYAQTIFNQIEAPYLFVYNVLIKGFYKNGGFRKVKFLFDLLRGNGLSPDNFTYPFVFKAIGCLKDVYEGVKIHGYVMKTGLEYDTYVCNSIMDMYAEFGDLVAMEQVFDEMPERDVVSWNVVIAGFVKCRRYDDAVSVYRRMWEESVKPEEATIVSTLTACIALKDLDLGKEIHHYVSEEFGFTTIIGNALLDMYAKCGCLSIARTIFDEIPRKNVICWTSMVSANVNCGQLDEARALFDRSPVKDIVLWTTMVNGYVLFNRFDEAVALFRGMQVKGIKPDRFMAVALLTGCAQSGALEQGRWIHGYIEENRIPLDAVVGTALIKMYANCGLVDKSFDIFDGLQEKDAASWTAIICALAMNGKTSESLNLFAEMNESGVKPDDITFIGVLSACSHGGLVEEGRRYFNLMKDKYRIEPKLEHYGCLVDLLGRAGNLDESEKLIEMIATESNQVRVPLYGSLLSSCRIHGNVEMGERLAERLVEIEAIDSSVHTLLANIYASVNRWEDMTRVRNNMKRLGVKKNPGCSAIEVNGDVHEFLAGDSSHLELEEVYSMLDRLAKPLVGSEELEICTEIPILMAE